jgi:predicted ATP-grasp superfamily ATP-dependent carboligase
MSRAKPAAVLLGGEGTAVPVARSLGRAGVPVVALGKSGDFVRSSRYCKRFVDLGSGEGTQERWLEWLAREAEPGSVVLPCADEGLEMVARNRAALEERGLVTIEADDARVLDVLDKERTHELALAAGVPVPRSAPVRTRDEFERAANEFHFPCALKPLHAHEYRRHFTGKGLVSERREELADLFDRTHAAGVGMLFTEMVPGPDVYQSMYAYMDAEGEPLFTFTKWKLRQYPIGFGAGCYHVMDWDPECAELGLKFFRSIGLRGLANIEFKRDERDGELKLIESNHRFTESTALHVYAGLDVPLFVYNRLIGEPTPHVGRPYRENLALWYPLDDFQSYLDYRRNGELTLSRWLKTLLRPQRFAMASFSDPGPMLNEGRVRMRGAFRRIRRKLRLGPRPSGSGRSVKA